MHPLPFDQNEIDRFIEGRSRNLSITVEVEATRQLRRLSDCTLVITNVSGKAIEIPQAGSALVNAIGSARLLFLATESTVGKGALSTLRRFADNRFLEDTELIIPIGAGKNVRFIYSSLDHQPKIGAWSIRK